MHSIPEQFGSIIVMLAQLNNLKTKKNGKEISMLDAYEFVEEDFGKKKISVLKYTADVRFKKKVNGKEIDVKDITSEEAFKMRRVYQLLHGGYRTDEKVVADTNIFGEMFFQLKRYAPARIMSMYKSANQDVNMGYWDFDENGVAQWKAMKTEGQLRTVLNLLASPFRNEITGTQVHKNLEIRQYENLVDLSVTFLMWSIFALLFKAAWDDDENEKDSVRTFAEAFMSEFSTSVSPLFIVDIAKGTSVSVDRMWKVTKATQQFLGATIDYYIMNNEKAALTSYGYLKGRTEIIKSIPIISSVYETERFLNDSKALKKSSLSLLLDEWFDWYKPTK